MASRNTRPDRRRPERDEEEDDREDQRDEEDDEEDERPEELPVLDESLDNVIAVDGLPVVNGKKRPKLIKVLANLFTKSGPIVGEIVMPMTEEGDAGESKGFAFIEYANAEIAEATVAAMNGFELDQNSTLKVTTFGAFKRFEDKSNKYVAPSEDDVRAHVSMPAGENLKWWVTDKLGRDQFVTKYQDECALSWNDERERPSPIVTKTSWTEQYLAWSPRGSYLCTFHAQGIVLWGGPDTGKLRRFEHSGVKLIDFSPCETYLVTWSDESAAERERKKQYSVMMWEVKSGNLMRGFDPPPPPPGEQLQWPMFQWSHDDKYFATRATDNITVYETPGFKILDKKKLSVPNVRHFEWSPTQNVLAAWVPEDVKSGNNKPARVVLIEIPSRVEIRQKNLVNVNDCKIYWHKTGDFLCVKVDRTTKTGKTVFVNFELFRMREKGIPIEVVEMKDHVLGFEWEPVNARFVVIHADNPASTKPDLSFYGLAGEKVKLIRTLNQKTCNAVFWSPKGSFIVLAGLGNLGGQLEFWGLDGPAENQMEELAKEEHYAATHIEWDPTGRYVVSYVSYWRHQLENGYKTWTFYGKPVHDVKQDRFYQFLWRPRPTSLLTKDHEKHIRKEFPTKSKEYDRIDYAREHVMDAAAAQRRKRMRDEWEGLLHDRERDYRSARTARIALRNDYDSDAEGEWTTIKMITEEVLDETKEIVEGARRTDEDDYD